jgi:hypothetical protein
MKKLLPKNFNDTLCLILIFLIVALWILTGSNILKLSAEVTGALIVTWTLLIQYYFRKKQNQTTEG